MIFFGETRDGIIRLPKASSVVINCELDVPADDMTVTFPSGELPPLRRIFAANDGAPLPGSALEGVVFCGIADEQTTSYDSTGAVTTVCARSPAALVLDSECEPGEYVCPTLDVMELHHLLPFGISAEPCKKTALSGTMNVSRGRSHYSAIRKFCSIFLGTVPRIDSLGRFRADVRTGGEALVFSANGIACTRLVVRRKRCSRISQVFVETSGGQTVVSDEDAVSDGIIRRRRISLLNSRTGTLSDADELIRKGRAGAFEAELLCPGFYGDIIGRSARIKESGLEDIPLIVTKTRFTGSAGVMTTRVTLATEEVI